MTELLRAIRKYVNVPAAQSELARYDDIQQEIAFHIEERTSHLIDDGMSPDKAKEVALARFGDPLKIAQACRREATGNLTLLHQAHLLITGLLTICVIVLFFVVVLADKKPTVQIPPGIRSMLDNDWSGTIDGVVVDSENRPVSNAIIVSSVKTWPDESFFLRSYTTTTNAIGEFELSNVYPVDEQYELNLVTFADLHGMQSLYVTRNAGGSLKRLRVELQAASGVTLKFADEKGLPISGLELRPLERVDTSGAEQTVYFDSARFVNQRTEKDGSISLPWFDAGDHLLISVRTPKHEWKSLDFAVPDDRGTIDILVRDGEFLPQFDAVADGATD